MDPPSPPSTSFDALYILKVLWGVVVTFTMFWFAKYVGKVDTLEKSAVTREELDKHLRDMRDERRSMHEENKAMMERGSNKMDRIDQKLQRLAIQVARGNREGNDVE